MSIMIHDEIHDVMNVLLCRPVWGRVRQEFEGASQSGSSITQRRM